MSDLYKEGIKQAVQAFDQLVQQGHIIRLGKHVAYDGTVGVTRIRCLVRAFDVVPDKQNLIIHHDSRKFAEFKAEQTQMANFERDYLPG